MSLLTSSPLRSSTPFASGPCAFTKDPFWKAPRIFHVNPYAPVLELRAHVLDALWGLEYELLKHLAHFLASDAWMESTHLDDEHLAFRLDSIHDQAPALTLFLLLLSTLSLSPFTPAYVVLDNVGMVLAEEANIDDLHLHPEQILDQVAHMVSDIDIAHVVLRILNKIK